MSTVTDLSGSIAQQAVEPITSSQDGVTNTGRSVSELIEADKYMAAKAAMALKRRGLLFTKLLPPGAAGDGPCGPCGGFGGGCGC